MSTKAEKIAKLKDQVSLMNNTLNQYEQFYNADGVFDENERAHFNSMLDTIRRIQDEIDRLEDEISDEVGYCEETREDGTQECVDLDEEKNPNYEYQVFGGTNYTVKRGDSLSKIAQNIYGDYRYWPLIRDANEGKVADGGNLILIGVELSIPRVEIAIACIDPETGNSVEIPQEFDNSSDDNGSGSDGPNSTPIPSDGDNGGDDTAQTVCNPVLQFKLDEIPVQTITSGTVTITLSLIGNLKAQKDGPCDIFTFSNRGYAMEAKQKVGEFVTGWKLESLNSGNLTLEHSLTGPYSTTKVKYIPPNAVKATCTAKPAEATMDDGWILKGTMGFAVTIVFNQPEPLPEPVPVPIRVPVYEPSWLEEHAPEVIGGALILTAGVIIVGTLAEDIITLGAGVADDPLSFAAAAALFSTGVAAF
jgi:hypothetical protein